MRGERGEVVGERERSVWRGVGWVGGTHPVFSVMLLCSSFPPLIFNVGKKKPMVAVWMRQTTSLQSLPPNLTSPLHPSLSVEIGNSLSVHMSSLALLQRRAARHAGRRNGGEKRREARWLDGWRHAFIQFPVSLHLCKCYYLQCVCVLTAHLHPLPTPSPPHPPSPPSPPLI